MRIGILTYNRAHNFGALLQAYALQEYLRDNGAQVYHIARKHDTPADHSAKGILKRMLKFQSYRAYRKFGEKLSFFPGEYDMENADQLNAHFDLFLSGSDQVWNITNGLNPMFFQSFVKGKVKASYSASIGVNVIPEEKAEAVKQALETFDYLAVRERTAQELLEGILDVPVQNTVDPVFLLSREQWDSVSGPRIEKNPYIFVYGTQMTQQLQFCARSIAKEKNLKVCSVFPMQGAVSLDGKIGPAEFVNYVKHAEYVMTTSFHCTAFALIYEKPLLEFLHSSTGSRAADLLDLVQMKERCLWHDGQNLEDMEWDYSQAVPLLEREVQKSKEYLNKIMGN